MLLRILWLSFRSAFFLAAVALTFVGGLSWVVLPGRFLLGLAGAASPELGKYAVLLSGVFYAGAALVAAVLRRSADEPEIVVVPGGYGFASTPPRAFALPPTSLARE